MPPWGGWHISKSSLFKNHLLKCQELETKDHSGCGVKEVPTLLRVVTLCSSGQLTVSH